MRRLYKNPYAWMFAVLIAGAFAVHSFASDPGYVAGDNPTRLSTLKVDIKRGTPINGMYIAKVTLAGDTTKDVTLTGMSANATVFTSKGTSTQATYVKTTTVAANVVSLTMSAATTGTVTVIALDTFTDPLTF